MYYLALQTTGLVIVSPNHQFPSTSVLMFNEFQNISSELGKIMKRSLSVKIHNLNPRRTTEGLALYQLTDKIFKYFSPSLVLSFPPIISCPCLSVFDPRHQSEPGGSGGAAPGGAATVWGRGEPGHQPGRSGQRPQDPTHRHTGQKRHTVSLNR